MDFLFYSTLYAFQYSCFQKQQSIANKSVFSAVERREKSKLILLCFYGLQASDHFLILSTDEAQKTSVNPTETIAKVYPLV